MKFPVKKLEKVVRVGGIPQDGSVFCKIEFEGGRLSITGVIGPTPNGDARGGCGQIHDSLREAVANGMTFADGWSLELCDQFLNIWERWHLNDMRAGCTHQREEAWEKKPIDPNKPLSTYGKHCEGQGYSSWNMLTWVTPKEHPDGLLGVPCSTCGYKYGTSWITEDVPVDVILFLRSLPDADRKPAWV